ncbi:hypothetical protein HJB56_31710 [Rhizobium lentis]|uniref:hypothetical protein n=1 Tax=Rhizobium TaxID=379 RepID=UPI001C82FFC4|nr:MULTISPECIES: hypothetical protein [Rhizobium]MBX4893475.1 hypothetical protein [Rhizobium bangladeshense]MBX4925785.1 hypothetical protein [Rhizobium binae]MBX5014288.1 hypothetical protein [Rhizobium lentis]MBX5020659.1 hypothetical protein [Rhizobium lentis]MBX5087276.1 hypothetical protein [Rhizobium lentis]
MSSVLQKRDDGSLPLKASFPLAISTPMINLPIERIWKPQMGHTSRAFERQRPKQSIGCGNSENIGEQPISQVPFYQPDAWRYHHLPMRNGPPGPFVRSACGRESCSRIASGADCRGCADAALFCNILRNGLAHGSVLHLAEHGRSTFGVPVRAFCFVSTKGKDRKVEACIFCARP